MFLDPGKALLLELRLWTKLSEQLTLLFYASGNYREIVFLRILIFLKIKLFQSDIY